MKILVFAFFLIAWSQCNAYESTRHSLSFGGFATQAKDDEHSFNCKVFYEYRFQSGFAFALGSFGAIENEHIWLEIGDSQYTSISLLSNYISPFELGYYHPIYKNLNAKISAGLGAALFLFLSSDTKNDVDFRIDLSDFISTLNTSASLDYDFILNDFIILAPFVELNYIKPLQQSKLTLTRISTNEDIEFTFNHIGKFFFKIGLSLQVY